MKNAFSGCSTVALGVVLAALPARAQVPHHDLAHVHFCDRTEAMLEDGDAIRAAREARAWLKRYPRDPDAFVVLGQVALLNGDFRGSLSFLQATYAANPLYRNVSEPWGDTARDLLHRYPNLHLHPVTSIETPQAKKRQALATESSNLLVARKYDALDQRANALLRSRLKVGSSWAYTKFALPLFNGPGDEKGWSANHAHLEAWHKARPHSLLARIAVARSWTNGAGIARGEGYASTITPQGSRVMSARLRRAAPLFQELVPDIGKSPMVFSGLQYFAKLTSMPRNIYFALFQRADAAFPNYAPYSLEAATYLMPRWFGKRGEWERFAAQRANRLGGARGDILYADIACDQMAYYGNDFPKNTSASYARIKRGLTAATHSGRDPLFDATRAFEQAIIWNDTAFARHLAAGPLKSHIEGSVLNVSTFNTNRIYAFRSK